MLENWCTSVRLDWITRTTYVVSVGPTKNGLNPQQSSEAMVVVRAYVLSRLSGAAGPQDVDCPESRGSRRLGASGAAGMYDGSLAFFLCFLRETCFFVFEWFEGQRKAGVEPPRLRHSSGLSSFPSLPRPHHPPHHPLLPHRFLRGQAAKARKASRIFAIDTNPSKFELAKQLGATDCLNPKDSETPIQQVSLACLQG